MKTPHKEFQIYWHMYTVYPHLLRHWLLHGLSPIAPYKKKKPHLTPWFSSHIGYFLWEYVHVLSLKSKLPEG